MLQFFPYTTLQTSYPASQLWHMVKGCDLSMFVRLIIVKKIYKIVRDV